MNMRRIAVLGAGTMGHGIAHAAMTGGFETRLYDVSDAAIEKASHSIEEIVRKGVELGKVGPADGIAILARLTTTTRLEEALADVDFVIEAAPERIDLKLDLFADIERFAPARAIVVSKTSALSITEMAGSLKMPSRVAGMHFFNPVHKMKLVEIVRALESSPETL